jgi:outer membrane lipoprotein-sorting protein
MPERQRPINYPAKSATMPLINRRTMLRLPTVAAVCVAMGPLARAARDPKALLVASDAIRNPGQSFKVVVTLTEFERGKQVDSSVLTSFSRTLDDSGQFVSLIQFVQPLRDAGKLLLKTGNDLWFYDPSTKASVRIAPQQRLMGQAANGDVVTVNLARDYAVQQATEESVTDGERRARDAVKLQLAAAVPDATYPAIELWVDAESAAPIKARFLAESGRLLKTAFFRRFQRQLGAERPTETVIIDGVNPQAVTLVRLSDYQAKPMPVSWFQRDYLPRFQGE